MDFTNIPVSILFGATLLIVIVSIELGFRIGNSVNHAPKQEKESPVSAIVASILGLLAFILAFTFGIVSDRFNERKALVREEASALRTLWLRADFLPDSNRAEVASLMRSYVENRMNVIKYYESNRLSEVFNDSERIQKRLWDMAVVNARADMNSDVAALYIEALNDIINVRALRLTVGFYTHLPLGNWIVLYLLVFLSMSGVGYQIAISGSKRTWSSLFLAIAFSLVIALIATLDRPYSPFLAISQEPLAEVLLLMEGTFNK